MPEFSYEAANAEGRMMKGQISAGSVREAQRSLRAQGLSPVEIGLTTVKAKPKRPPKKKSSRQDQILVMGELGVLLDAGVALAEAVKSLGHSDLPLDLSEAFDQIERGLRQGQRFSAALKVHLPMLPVYVHQLVAAGEMTGQLAEALRDGAAQMDYDYRVLQEIRNALVYPSVLVGAGVSAVLFIFIVVVPRFAAMFQSARIEIPMLSKIVLTIGLFTRDHLLELGLGFGLFVVTVLMLSRRPAVRAAAMEIAPKLPLFGGWLDETEVGRWAAMLSILLRNKIPLIQALELSRSGLRVPSVRDRMSQVEKAVRGGRSLADALAAHTDMMPIGLNLVRIGERAGNLPDMLKSLAALNERSAKDRMKRFLLVIEPLAIIIIGAVIGLIVTAIMLAVTSISNIQI